MAKSIEILENTILKLIVRQGTDVDRQTQALDSGELGYTTDTKRLYVGDNSLGGVLVGNKFLGSSTDVTTLSPASIGDLVFDENTNSLRICETGTGSDINDWLIVSGKYEALDGSIVVSADNKISVGSLSAGHVSEDLLSDDLELDINNRISLADDIKVVSIENPYGDAVSINGDVALEGLVYTFPESLSNNGYLQTDSLGKLKWGTLKTEASYFVANDQGIIPIGTIMESTSNALDSTWLLCEGQSLDTTAYADLFAVIGYTYGGAGANFNLPNFSTSITYGSTTLTASDIELGTGTSGLTAKPLHKYIKVLSDEVFNSTWTFLHPLSATIDGVDVIDTPFNPLSGDLVVSLPDATSIKGTVSFSQDGSIVNSFNTSTVSLTSDVFATDNMILPSGKILEYYDNLVVSDTTYYDGSGYTGAYIVTFENSIPTPADAIIEINLQNYFSEEVATASLRDVHTLYTFIDDTTLLVVIATSMDVDGITGYKLFLDSGMSNLTTPNGTRINVTIK